MAIQHRRGADVDFKAEKMLPGEIAVTIDGTRKVYAAFAPGDVKELASKEEVQKIVDNFEISVDEKINEAVQQVTDEATEQVEGIVAKGEEILNSIPADYQEAVKEVTQLKEELASTTQSKADAIICTSEGSTIVATDSSDAGFEGLNLYGKSKQGSTTGAQLLDISTVVNKHIIPDNGIMYDNDSWRVTEDYIKVNPLSDYCISQSTDAYFQFTIYFYDSERTYIECLHYEEHITKATFTTIENAAYIRIAYAVIVRGNEVDRGNIMLNAGIEPLPWEHYTGGKASPSPEYPQDIVSAGDSGSIDVKVCGKNIVKSLDITAATPIYDQALRVDAELKPSTTYTFSYKDSTGNAYYCNENIQTNGSLVQAVNGICKFTFTTKDTLDKNDTNQYVEGIGWIFLKNHKDNSAHMFEDFQIEYGTEATPYEPYKETSITLQTPNGLPGIKVRDASLATYTDENGDMWCADEVDFERGVYVQRIHRANIIDSFPTISASLDTMWYDSDLSYAYELKDCYEYVEGITNGLCSHFRSYYFGEFYNKGIETGVMNSQTYCVVNISKDLGICTTVDEFKTWCRDNNVELVKILAIPIETPLSDEEIAAYKALHTNKPTTTIMNSENVHMKAKYVADTKNHIKQNYVPLSEYTALEERVAAIEELVIS